MKRIFPRQTKFQVNQVIKLMRLGEDVRIGTITDTTTETIFVQFSPEQIEELSLSEDRRNIQVVQQAAAAQTKDRIVILHGKGTGLLNNVPVEATKLWSMVNASLKKRTARKIAETQEVIMYALVKNT